ncbi:hypothetical protein KEH59_27005 (plasmid) [Burkholderia contaminans]|uniref:hypothetical protein n=1 Tax=Burkholderia contaminans TaxID=488447 RepID=UPI001BAA02BF|nr:hypothetical protein [Burkholderia contaminans]QUN49902.1 hypothetical protein KEH59_27005 [Burkholderia contaminans]
MSRNNSNAACREVNRGFGRFGWPLLALFTISIAATLSIQNARATPVTCSPGYQDNTCLTPIYHDPIPAPQCAQGPGWVTTGSAVWQGSHWSQPQCSYQAPPSCPAGMLQTAAPTWTGSQWTQPGCQSVPPPAVDPIAQCAQAIAQRQGGYGITDANAATDAPVLEANNTLRWHYWTANNYSDWKITWNGVYAPPKQNGNLFSFTTNGQFVVVKGGTSRLWARLGFRYGSAELCGCCLRSRSEYRGCHRRPRGDRFCTVWRENTRELVRPV